MKSSLPVLVPTKNRRAFSLVEILIGLVIVALVFSLIGRFSYKTLRGLEFEQKIHAIESRIKDMKIRAVLQDADLILMIKRPNGVEKMLWNGAEVDRLQMVFYSNGLIHPEGELMLEHIQEKKCVNIQR